MWSLIMYTESVEKSGLHPYISLRSETYYSRFCPLFKQKYFGFYNFRMRLLCSYTMLCQMPSLFHSYLLEPPDHILSQNFCPSVNSYIQGLKILLQEVSVSNFFPFQFTWDATKYFTKHTNLFMNTSLKFPCSLIYSRTMMPLAYSQWVLQDYMFKYQKIISWTPTILLAYHIVIS